MSEVDVEVGQVWKDKFDGTTRTVLKLCNKGWFQRVYYEFTNKCDVSEPKFVNDYTLITNADGTPHVKRVKYREVTPMEGMKAIVDNDGPIKCQMSDFGDSWITSILRGIDLSKNTIYPFFEENNTYGRCRIEVKIN